MHSTLCNNGIAREFIDPEFAVGYLRNPIVNGPIVAITLYVSGQDSGQLGEVMVLTSMSFDEAKSLAERLLSRVGELNDRQRP